MEDFYNEGMFNHFISSELASLSAPLSAQPPQQPQMQNPTPVPPQQPYGQAQPQYYTPYMPQYRQPAFIPCPITETHDIEDGGESESKRIFFDANREHMMLEVIKDKGKFKHTESPDVKFGVRVNNHSSTKRKIVEKPLSTGCVDLVRVYSPTNEKGIASPPQCEVEIIYRDPIGRLILSVDAIRQKDKSVKEALAQAGVIFIDNGFKTWCEIFTDHLSKFKVHTEYMGFYTDESGRWCHAHAGDIAMKAVDSQGILERLGIDFSVNFDDNFLRLTLFLYGVCGRIFTVIRNIVNVLPMANLAIVYPERGAALEDLKALYCADNPPICPDKRFENEIFSRRDEVAVISLSASKYMNWKCLETLSQRGSELTALPLMLSEKEECFNERNDILRLRYDLTGMGDISGELCWAVRVVLNEPRLITALPKKFDWWCVLLKNDTETVGIRNLTALLLSLSEAYLPRLGIKENLPAILKRYRDYLLDSAYSPSDGVIDRLKIFLISWRDVPLERFNKEVVPNGTAIISKGGLLLVSSRMFGFISEKCGTTSATLADILKDEGILQGNNGSNMRNIRFGGTTERMYALDSSVLFGVGELRPMCPDDNAPETLYHIPIGTSDEYDIYYDIYPHDSMRNNPFALITGTTGTGKSTLCKTIAINAAELGLSVVILSIETSALDVECTTYEPGEDVEVSVDLFFDELKRGLNEDETALVDTASELMLGQDYTSHSEILTEFRELVNGEPNAECLLAAAQRVTDKLSGFSWDKAVIDGEISQVITETPEDADKLLLEFFNYKAARSEKRTTLLLIDEVQELSWDGKSPLVSKILRQGRKFGIAGVFSTQYLNADFGKNIASALKQIGTHFVFRPSDDIAALNQLGFKLGNDKAREILQFLDTGETLAKGNISTDICPLDYPVKITVDP